MTAEYIVSTIKQKEAKGALSPDDKQMLLLHMITVRPYVKYIEKVNFIRRAVAASFYNNIDNHIVNTTELNYQFIIAILRVYTNIDCTNDTYDKLASANLLNDVISLFSNEYQICCNILDSIIVDIDKGLTYEELLRAIESN